MRVTRAVQPFSLRSRFLLSACLFCGAPVLVLGPWFSAAELRVCSKLGEQTGIPRRQRSLRLTSLRPEPAGRYSLETKLPRLQGSNSTRSTEGRSTYCASRQHNYTNSLLPLPTCSQLFMTNIQHDSVYGSFKIFNAHRRCTVA